MTTSTPSATRVRTPTSRSPRARSISKSAPSNAGSTAASSVSTTVIRSLCPRRVPCPSTRSSSKTARSMSRSRPAMSELVISGLHASVRGTPILRGVDLVVRSGEVHAVMGPNGSGKSTLAHVLMGKPGYEVTAGSISLDGVDLVGLAPWQRARAGLFLGLQYPVEVPGVHVGEVLVEALAAGGVSHVAATERIAAEAPRLGLDDMFFTRALNVDLSGGEKKRVETFQLAVLRPKIAVLDELDS